MTFATGEFAPVMLALAIVGVYLCSSHFAAASEQSVTCSWGL